MKLILALDSGLSLVLLGHSIVSLQILKDIVCRMALGGRLGGSPQAGRENGEQTKVFIKLVAFFFFVKKSHWGGEHRRNKEQKLPEVVTDRSCNVSHCLCQDGRHKEVWHTMPTAA